MAKRTFGIFHVPTCGAGGGVRGVRGLAGGGRRREQEGGGERRAVAQVPLERRQPFSLPRRTTEVMAATCARRRGPAREGLASGGWALEARVLKVWPASALFQGSVRGGCVGRRLEGEAVAIRDGLHEVPERLLVLHHQRARHRHPHAAAAAEVERQGL